MDFKGKVRHLAPNQHKVTGENPNVCNCMVAERKLTKIKAEFTGDIDRIACLTCRKYFVA